MACGNCGQENCTNCSEVLCTSDITCVNAQFINLNIPAGAGLNDVLEALESYITNSVTDLENITISLSEGATCIGLTPGVYSYAQVFNAIITTICDIVGETPLNTDTLSLGEGITVPSCLLPFSGDTASELFNAIMIKLCAISGMTISGTVPYTSSEESSFMSLFIMKDLFSGLLDNHSFIYDQNNPVTDPNILSFDVTPMKGVVNDYPVKTTTTTTLSVTPTRDVYVFLDQDGTITKVEQGIGDPEPALPATKMFLYKATTSATGVASLINLFETDGLNPTPLSIPNDFIDTLMIKNANVTNVKLDDVATAGTFGHPSLIEIDLNTKGRITGWESNISLTGLADGDILVYNSGTGGFENQVPIGIGTNGKIPLASAGNFVGSSLIEGVSQVLSEKKMEVNTEGGVPVDDSNAVYTFAGGPILLKGISAADASALPVTDGYLINVNSTNGTFTSTGFWGVEGGAWVKL